MDWRRVYSQPNHSILILSVMPPFFRGQSTAECLDDVYENAASGVLPFFANISTVGLVNVNLSKKNTGQDAIKKSTFR